ncbi:DNA polymerase III subunit delta [Candidatus Parcubacteria bacterium]|nr:DNA polymerase III subunit delta [Candidatus Parcubacteria bacterium]
MLLFLYGQDIYRSRHKLNGIISSYKKVHQSGLNLEFFDGQNLDFKDFKNRINTISMFREKKLLVLKNVLNNTDFKTEFLKQKKLFIQSDDIIIFYEKDKIPANNTLLRFLKKEGKCQEFEPLSGLKLKNWIKTEISRYKAEIETTAVEKLVEFVGNDLWRLSFELQKLASYSLKIKKEDIELLVAPRIEADIFKTIDALAVKNKKEALISVHKHLEKGDSPLYILSMINFQFRNLLMVKDKCKNMEYLSPSASKELGIHPYVIRKTLWQTKRFSLEELKKIYKRIFKIDLQIKTGQVGPEVALDLLIAEI